jgi:hypothetical protein
MHQLKIMSKVPSTWKELQNLSAAVLIDCDFNVEIEKTIQTVRGSAEIDVYAEKETSFAAKVLCECKYWESDVPQGVVHGFRTVINDSGANYGYIISKRGFQKGAFEAAEKTSIEILTWDEFLERFKTGWLHHVIERNYKLGQDILNKKHQIITVTDKQRDINWDKFYGQAESDPLFLTFKEHYIDLSTQEISLEQIDAVIDHYKRELQLQVSSYKDYFDHIYEECGKILCEWKRLLK